MVTGRIIKGVSGLYFVSTPDGVYECIARGLFRQKNMTPLVGDRVDILITDEQKKTGFLNEIFERDNELIRPKAANVDLAVIVFAALNPAINLELLDGFLINAQIQKVNVVICVNKIDLAKLNSESTADEVERAYSLAGYKVVCVSAVNNENIDMLYECMKNKTSILAGPSGVGKSSVINAISDKQMLKTGELSQKIQRGKHTTRHAELLEIEENTYIVDSPGFTAIDISKIPKEDLKTYYPDFMKYAGNCYYGDCIHVSEHDCAVKNQVGVTIDEGRYNRYVRFMSAQD